jgi:hypothetical protein
MNVAFYVFAVGMFIFIVLSLVAKVEPSDAYDNDDNLDGDTRPLLKNIISANYGMPPEQPTDGEDDDVQSSITTHHGVEHMVDRRDSRISFANTVFSDDHTHRHSLVLHRTATSIARDVHLEASEMMDSLDHIPSLGLALSHIPSMETSLAFLMPHSPEEDVVSPSASILKSARVMTFLLCMLIFGVAFSMINQFLFLFLHNDLGVQSSILGWTGPVGGVTEVLTFWISKQVNIGEKITTTLTLDQKSLLLIGN